MTRTVVIGRGSPVPVAWGDGTVIVVKSFDTPPCWVVFDGPQWVKAGDFPSEQEAISFAKLLEAR